MKKYWFIFVIIIIISCNKEDNENPETEMPQIEITVFHENSPFMTRVFLYYNTKPLDFENFTYNDNGIYKKDDEVIIPNEILYTNSYGQLIIEQDTNMTELCAFVENQIFNRFVICYWNDLSQSIREIIYFN